MEYVWISRKPGVLEEIQVTLDAFLRQLPSVTLSAWSAPHPRLGSTPFRTRTMTWTSKRIAKRDNAPENGKRRGAGRVQEHVKR